MEKRKWRPKENRRQEGLAFVQHMLSLPLTRDIEMREAMPNISAVYIIYCKRFGVLYVGATKCLRKRWVSSGHNHSFLIDVPNAQIAWFPANLETYFQLERQLILGGSK